MKKVSAPKTREHVTQISSSRTQMGNPILWALTNFGNIWAREWDANTGKYEWWRIPDPTQEIETYPKDKK